MVYFISEAEIFAKPLVLLMEPYKRGKSSILPILLGGAEEEEEGMWKLKISHRKTALEKQSRFFNGRILNG